MSTAKIIKQISVNYGIHLLLFIIFTVLIVIRAGPLYDDLQVYSNNLEMLRFELQDANIDPENMDDLQRLTQVLQNTDNLKRTERQFYGNVFAVFFIFAVIAALILPVGYLYFSHFSWKSWLNLAIRFVAINIGILLLAVAYFYLMSHVISKIGLSDSAGGSWLVSIVFFILLLALLALYPIVAKKYFTRCLSIKKIINIHILSMLVLAIYLVISFYLLARLGGYFQSLVTLSSLFIFLISFLAIFFGFSVILALEKRIILTGNLFK